MGKLLKLITAQVAANLAALYLLLTLISFPYKVFIADYGEMTTPQSYEFTTTPLNTLLLAISLIITITLISKLVKGLLSEKNHRKNITEANKNLSNIFYNISKIDNNFYSNQSFRNSSDSLNENIKHLAGYLKKHYTPSSDVFHINELSSNKEIKTNEITSYSNPSKAGISNLKRLETHASFLHTLNNKLTILNGDTYAITKITSALMKDEEILPILEQEKFKKLTERYQKATDRQSVTFDKIVSKMREHQKETREEIDIILNETNKKLDKVG